MKLFFSIIKFTLAIIVVVLMFGCNHIESPIVNNKINIPPIDTFQIINELSHELIEISDSSNGPIFYRKNYEINIYRMSAQEKLDTIRSYYDIIFSVTNFGEEKVLMPLSVLGGFFPDINSKRFENIYFYNKGNITLRKSVKEKIEYDLDFCVLGDLPVNEIEFSDNNKRIDKEIVKAIQQIQTNSISNATINLPLDRKQKINLTPKCFYCKKVSISSQGNSFLFKEQNLKRSPLLGNEKLKIVEKGNILDTLIINEKVLNKRARDSQEILNLRDL